METDYVYEILSQGNCFALVDGAWFTDGNERIVVWNTEGLLDLYDAAAGKAPCLAGTHSLRRLLDLVRMALVSVYGASDWLVPADMLDMSPGGVWLDPKRKEVRFMLRPGPASAAEGAGLSDVRLAAALADRPCGVSGFPAAGIAADRINRAAEEGASLKDLIKLVCSLQLLTRVV